jgi:hypothetical protein
MMGDFFNRLGGGWRFNRRQKAPFQEAVKIHDAERAGVMNAAVRGSLVLPSSVGGAVCGVE